MAVIIAFRGNPNMQGSTFIADVQCDIVFDQTVRVGDGIGDRRRHFWNHVNQQAAWYYPDPKSDAAEIAGYIAFWNGVDVRSTQ